MRHQEFNQIQQQDALTKQYLRNQQQNLKRQQFEDEMHQNIKLTFHDRVRQQQ